MRACLATDERVNAPAAVDPHGYARTVDTHVTRLRRKLSAAGLDAGILHTVHGVGYAFEPEPSEASCDPGA